MDYVCQWTYIQKSTSHLSSPDLNLGSYNLNAFPRSIGLGQHVGTWF